MGSLYDRYGGWALITGASAGLGEEYARQLAREGFSLILVARRKERLEALADELGKAHATECLVVAQDLSQPRADAAIAGLVGKRPVGLLVNNAGFGFSGRFQDVPGERYASMVRVNCEAVTALAHRYLPPMLERGRGGMLVVASIAGYQATPFFAVYGATKAFDLMLGEALWYELRGTGVDVLAVSPGETETEFSSQAHFRRESKGASPEDVVRGSLRHLGRGPSYVPGALNKLSAFAHRVLPRSWTTAITGRVLAKELLRSTPAEIRAEG